MYSMPQMTTGCERGPRKRRPRTTVQQLALLQDSYLLDPMPCAAYREMLAEIVGLSSRSIQIWFQNRRQKLKQQENRETMERVQQRKEQALQILNSAFEINPTPDDEELQRLADEIGISTKSIHVWFQNRLAKQKVEDQFAIKKPSVQLSPSYFRPQQKEKVVAPLPTPTQIAAVPSNFFIPMPMMEMQSPMLYPFVQESMLTTPLYHFEAPEPEVNSCFWNPFNAFSGKNSILEQPLFKGELRPEDILKDFEL